MPYLIGVAGPSGAGKTLLSTTLARALDAPILSLDAYYKELAHLSFEERARTNFDEPDALDHDLLLEHITDLAADRAIDVPVYDFAYHTRRPETVRLEPAPFAIVEGLFALHWDDVRQMLGTGVYVDVADDLCFARRMERDIRERGRSRESVCEQYTSTVRPMAELYIRPSRERADVVVSGTQPVERSAEAVLAHVSSKCADKEAVARARAGLAAVSE